MDTKLFDRFAAAVADKAASVWFFGFCVLMVLVWAPSYFLFGNVDTWQLVINTATTIITFLLVALLHNEQHRNEQAMNEKLDMQARALVELLKEKGEKNSDLIHKLRGSIKAEQPD